MPDFEPRPEEIGKLRRYRALAKLQAYYDGTQYKGRPSFWTGDGGDGVRVPLRERAPCIVYPLPKISVGQAVRFTLGEGKFPELKVDPVEAPEAIQANMTVSPELAEDLTKLVHELVKHGRVRNRLRTHLRRGLSVGTGPAILSMQQGRLAVDLPHAKDCWPTFEDGPTTPVVRMTWCYRFEKPVRAADGRIEYKPFYFRRDVTDMYSVAYHDAEDKDDGKQLRWVLDEDRSYEHGLRFCPVVWSRNFPDEHPGDMDGTSLYADLFDELDSLNFALSQRHRGIALFGTPQPWEIGVREGDGPGAGGRTARSDAVTVMGDDNKAHTFSGPQAQKVSGSSQAARMTAPDEIWSFAGHEVKLGLMETTGAAFECASHHVDDARSRLLEVMSVVLVDPKEVVGNGDLSARALALLHAPLLALVGELRDDWWLEALEPILSMALRMVATLDPTGLLIPGATKVWRELQRFRLQDGRWLPPRITPTWGDHFAPSNAEKGEGVNVAKSAKDASLVAHKTAARSVAKYFGVADLDAELEEAEKERQERAAEQQEAFAQQAKAAAPPKAPPPAAPPKQPKGPK